MSFIKVDRATKFHSNFTDRDRSKFGSIKNSIPSTAPKIDEFLMQMVNPQNAETGQLENHSRKDGPVDQNFQNLLTYEKVNYEEGWQFCHCIRNFANFLILENFFACRV